jgi:hypothetical protein
VLPFLLTFEVASQVNCTVPHSMSDRHDPNDGRGPRVHNSFSRGTTACRSSSASSATASSASPSP